VPERFLAGEPKTRVEHGSPFAALNPEAPVNINELLHASLFALGIGIILSFVKNHRHVMTLASQLSLTRRYGDEDVWESFHNDKHAFWVIVRDHKLDLVYFAYVNRFSESEQRRELLLRQVSVFSNVGQVRQPKLYEVDSLYLERNATDLSIEIPYYPGEHPKLNAPSTHKGPKPDSRP